MADPPAADAGPPDSTDGPQATLRPVIERVTPVSTLILAVEWDDIEGRRTRHEYRIEPIRSGTRLHQSHSLVAAGKDGPPDPFSHRAVRGVELMNAALKARAER